MQQEPTVACGLPCGPKMHAAFHAGGKCMRPSVRADNARGAEWCLLNPTGRPYEAFVAAEVAVFFFFVVAFCTVVGLFVVIAVVAVVVVIDVVVAVDVAVIVVTVVTVVLVVTVVVRVVIVAAAVVAIAVAVAVVVVIVVVVVVVVVVAHLLGVVGIDADVVVGGGIDAGVGVRVGFVLVVGDGALFLFGVVKLQQLLQQRESPTNTRVESKSIIRHLVHLQAAGKAACIDRPRGSAHAVWARMEGHMPLWAPVAALPSLWCLGDTVIVQQWVARLPQGPCHEEQRRFCKLVATRIETELAASTCDARSGNGDAESLRWFYTVALALENRTRGNIFATNCSKMCWEGSTALTSRS